MIRSLLVPLDGSSFGERSLPLASEIAKATGAALHLAHVHVPYEPEQLLSNTSFHWEGVDMGEYDARARRREEEYLSDLRQRLDGNGTAVASTVLEGEPVAGELAAYADSVGTDLILITSHGYSGVKRAWMGSVADAVLHRTGVPMLVVHPPRGKLSVEPPTGFRHVLLPLDGSSLAESMVGPASDVAKATGARVTLTRVVSPPATIGPRALPLRPEQLEQELDRALAYLEDLAAGMRWDGLDVEARAVYGGTPARMIARVAREEGADLIALATHGYGGLKRTVLGSVADKLLRVSRLPLFVLRPPAQA